MHAVLHFLEGFVIGSAALAGIYIVVMIRYLLEKMRHR